MRGRRQGKPNARGTSGFSFRAGIATLFALAVSLAAPLGAHAATTIGQTPPPPASSPQEGKPSMLPTLCPAGVNLVQSKSALPAYAVSDAGVITSWGHRGATLAQGTAGTGKLVVWRPAGDLYAVVGKSAVETFPANTLRSFSTRVPVQAGDLLGLRTETNGVACFFSNFQQSSMEDQVRFQGGGGAPSNECVESSIAKQTFDEATCHEEFCATFIDPLPVNEGQACRDFPPSAANAADPEDGSTQTFDPVPADGARVNVSAVIEPDADGDGFGDETQDLCPTDASTAGTCPPPPAPPTELPGPAPDLTPPELSLFGKASQPLRQVVRVAAVCPTQACEVIVTGRLIVRPPARERRGPRRIRGFKLGSASATMGAGEKTAMRLRVRKPALKAAGKAVKQGGSVRAIVRARAIDEAGNDTYARKGVTLGK